MAAFVMIKNQEKKIQTDKSVVKWNKFLMSRTMTKPTK